MKTSTKWRQAALLRVLAIPLAIALVFPFTGLLRAQEAPAARSGRPDDWSHHRLVFADPGTEEYARRNGTHERWLLVVHDPRFQLQQSKRDAGAKANRGMGAERSDFGMQAPDKDEDANRKRKEPGNTGPNPEGPLPRGLSRAIVPPANFRDGKHPEPEGTHGGDAAHTALHTDWSENMGSGATAGMGMYPAKFSFGASSANCGNSASPDFVVFNTGLAGLSGQASIVAYDNLYSGCTGTAPAVYWAYNTNGGKVVTSIALSPDGTQVAFAQSTGGVASLVVLKWAASGNETPSSPATLTVTAPASYRSNVTCPAPCMTSLTFSDGADDNGSSPFYDYNPGSDTLYIGDDSGMLHKFMGVFSGTPAEATGAWPVAASSAALGSPVYDSTSGNVFFGDYLRNLSSTCAASGTPCGYFYSVAASSGAVVGKSNRLDYNFGIVDAPLIDSTAGTAYVFAGLDSNGSASSPCGANLPCSGVFQFPTNFTAGGGVEAAVGPGYEFLYSGTFDNAYFTSASPATPTGHLYVVGNTGPGNNTLYQLSINGNVMSTSAVAGPSLSTNYTNSVYAAGLPISENYTGTADLIFLSVLAYGVPANCNGSLTMGCVLAFDVTSGSISGSTSPSATRAEAGGASGIVIDNSSSFAGASNVYFTTLADQPCTTSGTTGGCAIQTTQSGLH